VRAGPGTWLLCARGQVISVLVLLTVQAGLLAYSATRHSPTHLEPAFLVAGISHWQFGKFELYRVNPPLPRMIAAIPLLITGFESDWRRFTDEPGSRAEYSVGEDFIRANGANSILLILYARWACIPFALLGAFVAYLWAKGLYGPGAGLVTLILYVFEPNLLAHNELVTPDAACIAFGLLAGYTFWNWLRSPSWDRALIAGGALGLAQLSKTTWLILFGLWPLLWLVWRYAAPQATDGHSDPCASRPSPMQLATILLVAFYLINLGYVFDETCLPIKDFAFVSRTLTGKDEAGAPGNRFRGTWLESLPIPLPKQYVLGVDSQKKDFEHAGLMSYLRGEWRQTGWFHYYIYGLLVKVPCGIWGLLVIVVFRRVWHRNQPATATDEMVLLAPTLVVFLLVSSQTEFNIHLRYVFPSLALMLIFAGQSATNLGPKLSLRALLVVAGVAFTVGSTFFVYPHQLAYFNELAGGPNEGYKHLAGSSLDWGQDVLLLRDLPQNNLSIDNTRLHLKSNSAVVGLLLRNNIGTSTEHASKRYDLWSIERYTTEFGAAAVEKLHAQTRIGYSMLLIESIDAE
jgi:hypothetical protein